VLLTGATGAIGRPLLRALVAGGVERVYALTHVERLDGGHPCVVTVRGDISAGADLGLDATAADEIRSTIAGVIHGAADTRFGAPLDEARRVNRHGTLNVLAFASRCRRVARVVALSTTHVAGRRTGDVFEHELEHDAGFVNAYEASKYETECDLRARAGDLPISVCRLSTVIGDSRSGEIPRRGAIHQAVLFMYASLAPMMPGREDSPVDMVSLDYAVQAIAWLATGGFEAGRTWHLCAGADTIAAGELLDLTLACFETYRPAWRQRGIARPALVDLPTFELFRRSIAQVGDSTLRASMEGIAHFAPQLAYPKRFDNRVCVAALAGAALTPPPLRDAWRSVVRLLVQPSAATATEGTGDAA
jgi:nucleoside-diphosphate-sugar epimerase